MTMHTVSDVAHPKDSIFPIYHVDSWPARRLSGIIDFVDSSIGFVKNPAIKHEVESFAAKSEIVLNLGDSMGIAVRISDWHHIVSNLMIEDHEMFAFADEIEDLNLIHESAKDARRDVLKKIYGE